MSIEKRLGILIYHLPNVEQIEHCSYLMFTCRSDGIDITTKEEISFIHV
jgi:hypothetical protein